MNETAFQPTTWFPENSPLVNSPRRIPTQWIPPWWIPPPPPPENSHPENSPLVNSHPYIFTCFYPILGFEIIEFYKIEIFL